MWTWTEGEIAGGRRTTPRSPSLPSACWLLRWYPTVPGGAGGAGLRGTGDGSGGVLEEDDDDDEDDEPGRPGASPLAASVDALLPLPPPTSYGRVPVDEQSDQSAYDDVSTPPSRSQGFVKQYDEHPKEARD